MDGGRQPGIIENVSAVVRVWRNVAVAVPYLLAAVVVAAIVYLLLPHSAPQPQVGRFQLGGVPGHVYVIDTATGQVWEQYAAPSEGQNDAEFRSTKLK